jgi:hypothetical protein
VKKESLSFDAKDLSTRRTVLLVNEKDLFVEEKALLRNREVHLRTKARRLAMKNVERVRSKAALSRATVLSRHSMVLLRDSKDGFQDETVLSRGSPVLRRDTTALSRTIE